MIEESSRAHEVFRAVEPGVGSRRQDLLRLSERIHAKPELRFEETAAAGLLCDFLAGSGFEVQTGTAGLATAFLAERRFSQDGPTVAIFCEYDALAGLGHACGHNIIAAAGAGGAVAAADYLAGVGSASGRLLVVGSPGEEGGGGKVLLLEAGALDQVDAAIMVHPAGFDAVHRPNLGRVSLEVEFTGKASHAAAAPERGVNALDATTLFLVAVGLLRQQLRSDSRVHAIVVEGGEAVNVIPERCRVRVFVRSPDHGYLRGRLMDAVRACADGAAIASGTSAEVVETSPAYAPMRANPVLAELVGQALRATGRSPASFDGPGGGSTDMGNVSQVIPAVHPYLCVAPDVALHTREFEAAAGSAEGEKAVVDGAAVLGTVAAVLLTDPALVRAAKSATDGAGDGNGNGS